MSTSSLVSRPPTRLPVRPPRRTWESRYVHRLLLTDLIVGLIAADSAYALRFGAGLTDGSRGYLVLSAVLPVAWVVALGLMQAYERRHLFIGGTEYERVFRAGVVLTASITFLAYALDLRLVRGYVVLVLPMATVCTVLSRFALRKRLHRARAHGACLRRVLVVGHADAVAGLCRQLRRQRYHGLDPVGGCLPGPPAGGRSVIDGVGLPVYGTFDDLGAAVAMSRPDSVIVLSCPELDGVLLRRLAWQLERDDIDLIVASALMDVAGDRTTIRPVDGLPMLHVEHPRLRGARRVVKGVADRLGAAVLLALLAPVLLAVAVAVRAGSPGPVLFRQVRVGRGGAEFTIYKFRTMRTDAEERLAELRHLNEQDGVLFKLRDDPRVTRVGRYLRRFSLDELPQLVNVLTGDMSLVGPRPPLPAEVAAYPEDMRRRLVVKPGLTGLWQVSGRAELSWEEAVRLDLRYVENWSLSLDLVILLRTLTAVLRASGAY
jgi:exopolysaccharide biosynthesis polyprenyl glycosylphosphotransferase